MTDSIESVVKDYIMKEFLPDEDPVELTHATPLITGGILDSIATMKLVLFMEERYGVRLEAHETDPEHLDTISTIAELIRAKRG